jgi:hypothetical protein
MASLEERIAAIEDRLGMESGLRASQDRDLADLKTGLRAVNNLLQALALTQADQSRDLAEIVTAQVDQGERLIRLEGGVQQIIALLNQLIERGD